MTEREICSLEYLIGTLATAYKGTITSLVVRDFCILDKDGVSGLKGTVIAMPEGEYDAVLTHEGIELSRTGLRRGYFELKAESGVVRDSTNLQIDIMQRGRHIGTFLLRKAKADNLFISALELSEEVKGLHFGALIGRLRGRPGLMKKGEHIISRVLSTKKDWGRFSDEIGSFAQDLFWFDRDSFYAWSDALVRYAFLSAEKAGPGEKEKAAENVLSMLELVLENEKAAGRAGDVAAVWLGAMRESGIDWSLRARRAAAVLSGIRGRFPESDIVAPLRDVLSSLRKKAEGIPSIPAAVREVLGRFLPTEETAVLDRFGPKRKAEILETVRRAGDSASAGDYKSVFGLLEEIEPLIIDSAEMVRTFFRVVGRRVEEVAPVLADVLSGVFPVFRSLPGPVYKQAAAYLSDLLQALLAKGMTGESGKILGLIDEGGFRGEEIILNSEVAGSVLGCGDDGLIEQYKKTLERYRVPPPGVRGFSGETWAEIADPLHLERLSRFLRIAALDRAGIRDVLIRLICNLCASGVFIPDDRLFQREVSAYLNSARMDRDFFLHRLLLRRLPVFFNEVGATGDIREHTTEIDSWGNDPVLYFLRKQVHVNASNYNVPLVESVIRAWATGSSGPLKNTVPKEVLARLEAGLLERYYCAAAPILTSLGVLDRRGPQVEKIVTLPGEAISSAAEKAAAPEELKSKVVLLLRIYQRVVNKYAPGGPASAGREGPASMGDCVERMARLKGTITSREKTQAEESFYFKRHIAFGIPSVMGAYHEQKFDAMKELFGLEERLRVFFEQLIAEIEEKGKSTSAGDVSEWVGQLEAAGRLFGLQDLGNLQVDEIIAVLRTNALRAAQIVDLLRIWQKELTWMVESFYRTFHAPLISVLEQFPEESLPPRLGRRKGGKADFSDRAADILIREMMAGVAGFLELDRLLGAIISALRLRVLHGGDLQVVPAGGQIAGIGGRYYLLDELNERQAMNLSPVIGGKAKNLVCLRAGGLRVPASVVFPASADSPRGGYAGEDAFESALREAVAKIGGKTGLIFGDDANPLFLSVRSGSYISMPGILSSVLYVGMNDRTMHALIEREKDEWLGWDSMRRFLEHYGTVVLGLGMDFFESAGRRATGGRTEFRRDVVSSGDMQAVVRGYREELAAKGHSVPGDVFAQLRESVKAVYASWRLERSLRFREAMEISAHWGTSVTLMQMVYGNARGGGASVFYTRNPFTLEKGVYGDTREQATGGDLVYGTLVNRPLSREQEVGDRKSLEETDPELFGLHAAAAARIEEKMGGLPQEVEVTYTRRSDGRRTIHVLQTRRMEFHRGFTKRFSDVCGMQSSVIGRGAGVHGGALSGIVTFSTSKDRIRKLRESAGMPVILIRQTANTDDVSLMPLVDGIVTAGGGVASHASVLAQKFDLTAVVGCEAMEMGLDDRGDPYAKLGGREIRDGSELSIDGSTGLIYSAVCPDFE